MADIIINGNIYKANIPETRISFEIRSAKKALKHLGNNIIVEVCKIAA